MLLKESMFPSFKEWKAINEKSANQQYSYGCIMGYFDLIPEEAEQFNILKNDQDLYDPDGEHVREPASEYHVTVLYGLHPEVDESEIIQLLKMTKTPKCKLVGVSAFQNDEYDVLKWDVESPELHLLNKICTNLFPYTNKFPEYHPHATIAYLNPGTSSKYVTKDVLLSHNIKRWVYSKTNGQKITVYADGSILKPGDQSYYYKGYWVELLPWRGNTSSWMLSVYLNGEYKMGLKGPSDLNKAKEAAEIFINGEVL